MGESFLSGVWSLVGLLCSCALWQHHTCKGSTKWIIKKQKEEDMEEGGKEGKRMKEMVSALVDMGEIREGDGYRYNPFSLYTCMKFSIKILIAKEYEKVSSSSEIVLRTNK